MTGESHLQPLELTASRLDLSSATVMRDDECLPLRKLEVRFLAYLIERANQVVTREELLVEVWGYSPKVQTRAIDITAARIRKKIEATPSRPEFLISVRGQGYKWSQTPAEAERPVPRALPVQRTRFVGRDVDVQQLCDRLLGSARIVTVLGPGGIGKTRVSLEVGRRLGEHYPGGVWFCDVSAARSALDVASALAQTLGGSLVDDAPCRGLEGPLQGLGRALLIIDNFEQVVDSARETIGDWSDCAPDLDLLVTSRTRLGLLGEQLHALAALPLEEASELLGQRIRAVRPRVESEPDCDAQLQRLAVLLEGHPLSIELAATRARSLSLSQLLKRLENRFALLSRGPREFPERHTTLWNTIDWSWQLLEPIEQTALKQLTVFRGPFDLEAAEAVLDFSGGQPVDELDILESLCDQSILQVSEPTHDVLHFSLAVSIRGFVEQQRGEGDDEVAAAMLRHATWFAALADPMAAVVSSPESLTCCEAALERMERRGEALLVCKLAYRVASIRWVRGPRRDGIAVVERALETSARYPEWEVWLKSMLSRLLFGTEHTGRALELLRSAHELCERQGFSRPVPLIFTLMSPLYRKAGDAERALEVAMKAIDTARELGDHLYVGHGYKLLAHEQMQRSRLEDALEMLERAWHEYAEHGHDHMLASVLLKKAQILNLLHRSDRARVVLEEATEHFERLPSPGLGLAHVQQQLGRTYERGGELDRARTAYAAAIQTFTRIGGPRFSSVGVTTGALGCLERRAGDLDRSAELLARATFILRDAQPLAAAHFLGFLACVRAERGDDGRAIEILDDVDALLGDESQIGRGHALCRRAEVQWRVGRVEEAHETLARAREVAAALGLSTETPLSRELRATAALLRDA